MRLLHEVSCVANFDDTGIEDLSDRTTRQQPNTHPQKNQFSRCYGRCQRKYYLLILY